MVSISLIKPVHLIFAKQIGRYRAFFYLGSITGHVILTWVMTYVGSLYCFYVASAFLLVSLIPSFHDA